MADDSRETGSYSLADLYVDVLWNVDASARIMLVKLPGLASAASDQEVATVLRDCLGVTSHHHAALERILAHFGKPSRAHDVELEALLGRAAQRLSELASSDTKDLAVCAVVRTALHMAIPQIEMAMNLAGALGYEAHIEPLASMLHDVLTTDGTLATIVRSRLDAHTQWTATHPAVRPVKSGSRL